MQARSSRPLEMMLLALLLWPRVVAAQTVLVTEEFENNNFASRGWYDSSGGTISTVEHLAGSTASFECRFAPGATGCSGGGPGRHLFPATESVYLSFHIKHSSSWVGSGKAYHPHLFHFITDRNTAYVGPAYTHLTAYVEENQGYPQLAIQDGQNIDESKVGQNLIGVTEQRAVAGCNGVPSNIGQSSVDCYLATAGTHWNGIAWKGPSASFLGSGKTSWHLVEAYFKLNTISGGVGQANGVVRYWYDGQLVIDHQNVILRTGQHPTMKFNQFLVGPWIGDGSPVDQTIWVDRLTIATGRPGSPIPDAAVLPKDAAILPKDAAVLPKDAAVVKKDAAVVQKDAAVVKKDVAQPSREAALPGLDLAPAAEAGQQPDRAPVDSASIEAAPGGADRAKDTPGQSLTAGCGCAASPDPAAAGLAALLLAVGLLLRRRRT